MIKPDPPSPFEDDTNKLISKLNQEKLSIEDKTLVKELESTAREINSLTAMKKHLTDRFDKKWVCYKMIEQKYGYARDEMVSL